MMLSQICPFVRQVVVAALNASMYKNRRIKTRDNRLFYILQGNGSICIENKSYPLAPGTVILFQAETEYAWQITHMRYISVNFDYTQDNNHIRETFSPIRAEFFPADNFAKHCTFEDAPLLNAPLVFSNAFAFENKLMSLSVERQMGGDFCDELLSCMLKSIVLGIVRLYNEQHATGDPLGSGISRRIIEYIQRNFSAPITNQDIAREIHFNASYMNRAFKAHTGMTVHSFLVDCRLNFAMELLRSEDIPIHKVAQDAGFSDIPHFTKTFKTRIGQTPRAYRQQHLTQKKQV